MVMRDHVTHVSDVCDGRCRLFSLSLASGISVIAIRVMAHAESQSDTGYMRSYLVNDFILGCSVKIDKASRLRTRVNFSRTRNSYADTERIRHTPRPPWRQGP